MFHESKNINPCFCNSGGEFLDVDFRPFDRCFMILRTISVLAFRLYGGCVKLVHALVRMSEPCSKNLVDP